MRDDDACEITPQLERLSALANKFRIEIGLAVIPANLDSALVDRLLDGATPFHALCHGWKHTNFGPHSRPGEFGPDRPLEALRSDAMSAFSNASLAC